MKRVLLAVLLLLIVGMIGIFLDVPSPDAKPSAAAPPIADPPNSAQLPSIAPVPSDSSIPLALIADSRIPPEKRIRRVYEMLQAFAMATKSRGGVPLSSNMEITRALGGRNPLGIVFLPTDHPAVSAAGEILDPWETPYFFHALAADSWEIVSAGPDRVRFNADDLVFPPPRNSFSLGKKSDP